MDIPDVPHLHSLTDWSPDGRRGVEDVNGIHLSECRVTIRAHQKNQVFWWQCITPKRIQAPRQLGLGARALARVNNYQPLAPDLSGPADDSGMAIRNACPSRILSDDTGVGRTTTRCLEQPALIPNNPGVGRTATRCLEGPAQIPNNRTHYKAGCQTLQFRQRTQADDLGLRLSHRTPRMLGTLSSTGGYLR